MTISIVDLIAAQDLPSRVASVCQTGHSYNREIHVVGCSLIQHAMLHGDYTQITALCDGLPNGTRVKALAFWFSHFTNGRITLSRDKDTKAYRVNKEKFKGRSPADFNLEGAMATPFDELTEEKDPQTLTVLKWFKSLQRTAVNAEKHDGTEIDKVDVALRALASRGVEWAKQQPEYLAAVAASK